jgi:biotin transport system substrate-specific component
MTIHNPAGSRFSIGGVATDTALVILGSVLLAAVARISVPFVPVPMTMQSLVVVALGLTLGARRGALAVLLYLAEGAAGFPVFAGTPEKGIGLAYMAGPTGGFLAGFVLTAFAAGWLAERGWDRSMGKTAAAALIAIALMYLPGLLWLGTMMGFNAKLLAAGLYPFIPADLTKAALAAVLIPTIVRPLMNLHRARR